MVDSLRDELCIPYLDDILCFGKTFSDHVQELRRVLRVLKDHGVKLRPAKCDLFKREVRYVGRLVSEDGVRPKRPRSGPLPKRAKAHHRWGVAAIVGVPQLLPQLHPGFFTNR